MINIKNICYSYNQNTLLIDHLNLQIKEGELVSIVGSSGSGKTTLFKLLMGILKPISGNIHYHSNLNPAYMTQHDLLLPWKTVFENIMLPYHLGKKKVNFDLIKEKAKDFIQKVGLEDKIFCYPDELSGGMRQRVSLLRALITESPIILLDEPFSSLDFITKEVIYDLLKKLHREKKMTMLLVTHDFRDAFALSDKIFHLSDGKIVNEWIIDQQKKEDIKFFNQIIDSIKISFNGTAIN